MHRRSYLAALGSSLAVALAGCTSMVGADPLTPTPETQTVRLQFTNGSDSSATFTAAVVPDGYGGVRISYADGPDRTLPDVEDLNEIPAGALDGAVSLAPLAENAVVRRFRSTAGSGVGMSFEDLPLGTWFLLAVGGAALRDGKLSLAGASCEQADTGEIRVELDRTGSVGVHTTCVDEEAT